MKCERCGTVLSKSSSSLTVIDMGPYGTGSAVSSLCRQCEEAGYRLRYSVTVEGPASDESPAVPWCERDFDDMRYALEKLERRISALEKATVEVNS